MKDKVKSQIFRPSSGFTFTGAIFNFPNHMEQKYSFQLLCSFQRCPIKTCKWHFFYSSAVDCQWEIELIRFPLPELFCFLSYFKAFSFSFSCYFLVFADVSAPFLTTYPHSYPLWSKDNTLDKSFIYSQIFHGGYYGFNKICFSFWWWKPQKPIMKSKGKVSHFSEREYASCILHTMSGSRRTSVDFYPSNPLLFRWPTTNWCWLAPISRRC